MFSHMLVPLDGSELAECALPHAIVQARAMGARLTLLHSLERNSTSPVKPVEWHMRKAQASIYLQRTASRLKPSIPGVETALVEGPAAESIIEYAHGNDVDFMVVSTHGASGLTGWNISSVVQKVILRSYTSTLLVRAYRQPVLPVTKYERILLALDCSGRSESTLPVGTVLARENGAELILAHVVRTPDMPRRLPPDAEDEELKERFVEKNRAEASRYLRHLAAQFKSDMVSPAVKLLVGGSVTGSLERLVKKEDIDLVIISAHGSRNATDRPYGSVAMNFIVYGTAPLLVMQDIHHTRAPRTRAEEAAGENSGH
jgi:nucleotide-binding universal stress UspA family protein